jgi:hypothetical protein
VPKLAPRIIGISGIELNTVPRAILGRQAPLVQEAPTNTADSATPILPEVQRSLQFGNVRTMKTKARLLDRMIPPIIVMTTAIGIGLPVSTKLQASLTPSSPIEGTRRENSIGAEMPPVLSMSTNVGKTRREH